MHDKNDLLMDISILYRNTQKYFDRALEPFKLTYGQLPVLLFIYEHEGTTMQSIVENGQYDKGTVTKNVQKLENLGYIKIEPSKQDKRQKLLYPTKKSASVMAKIYQIRQDWWMNTIEGIDAGEILTFEEIYQKLSKNINKSADLDLSEVRFYSLQKMTLNAYPGKLCAVLSVGGCNLKCPNCTQKPLVYLKENRSFLPQNKITHFLEERKDFLQAISLHGGEITLHPELLPFFQYAQSLGYKIQIETNGTNPGLLKEWISQKAVDRIILHIKASKPNYAKAVGIDGFDLESIQKSLELLKKDIVDYQIQTDLQEDMDEDTLMEIAQWIQGCKLWVWQVKDHEKKDMDVWKSKCQPLIENIRLKTN